MTIVSVGNVIFNLNNQLPLRLKILACFMLLILMIYNFPNVWIDAYEHELWFGIKIERH